MSYSLLLDAGKSKSSVTSISVHLHIENTTNTLCQGEAGLRDQFSLFQVYHNFVLPHVSLRQPLAEPMATNGRGAAKLWRRSTPAMAAGLTDRVWSLKEVLLYRVPPWPPAQMV